MTSFNNILFTSHSCLPIKDRIFPGIANIMSLYYTKKITILKEKTLF